MRPGALPVLRPHQVQASPEAARKPTMHAHDDFIPKNGELTDRLADAGRLGSFDWTHDWSATGGGIEGLLIDSAHRNHTRYEASSGSPHVGEESSWPSYRPYEPELPPPPRYERLDPPPPILALGREPEPVRYEDGLTTQAQSSTGVWPISRRLPGPCILGGSPRPATSYPSALPRSPSSPCSLIQCHLMHRGDTPLHLLHSAMKHAERTTGSITHDFEEDLSGCSALGSRNCGGVADQVGEQHCQHAFQVLVLRLALTSQEPIPQETPHAGGADGDHFGYRGFEILGVSLEAKHGHLFRCSAHDLPETQKVASKLLWGTLSFTEAPCSRCFKIHGQRGGMIAVPSQRLRFLA